MMSTQYYQLAQYLDLVLQKVNNIHGLKFLYNIGKKIADPVELEDLNLLESVTKPFYDPFTESRQMFSQWVIQSDVYITNSNFSKDNFLKRFVKQRDKVESEFDKIKLNSTGLSEKIAQLRIQLDALEKHGKRVSQIPNLEKQPEPQTDNTMLIEKGKPYDALKQVSQIFRSAKGPIKIMDKWISDKTLEFLASAPDVQIRVLTSNIEERSQTKFDILLRRINEQRTNPIQVKKCDPKGFHDRYIITKNELWVVGGSLKDIGYKTWSTINKVDDEETRSEISNIFSSLWKVGK